MGDETLYVRFLTTRIRFPQLAVDKLLNTLTGFSTGRSGSWYSWLSPSSSSMALARVTAVAASCSAGKDSRRACSSRFLLAKANSSSRLFLSSRSSAIADLDWSSLFFLCISPHLPHELVAHWKKSTSLKHVTQSELNPILVKDHFCDRFLRLLLLEWLFSESSKFLPAFVAPVVVRAS